MMLKESFFREQKRFHLFKSLLSKSWRAQNMPLEAGCLDIFFSEHSRRIISGVVMKASPIGQYFQF